MLFSCYLTGCSRRGQLFNDQLQKDLAEISDRLGKYLDVSKGEITRLDYIVTQFLQAIRPTAPQLQQASLNDVVDEVVEHRAAFP